MTVAMPASPTPVRAITPAGDFATLQPTLAALADFPRLLRAHYAAVPEGFAHWAPASWDGIPSERFTPMEQVLHVRDIEREGYHVRLHRTLEEDRPTLADIDSYELAAQRGYAVAAISDADAALDDFARARALTVALLHALPADRLERTAIFEGIGPVTLRGLVHYLCSHDQQHLAGLQWLLARIESSRHPDGPGSTSTSS
jgi:hypothetical protein